MTHQLKRILVAVDDSDASKTAVDEGIALAADDGAEIVFAHVVAIVGEQFVPGTKEPARVPGPAETPSLKAAEARAADAGVACTTELLVGYAPRQLALVADDRDVDLIVVGSRHLKGLKRVLLGSTSRALLAESTRAVLVVPYVPVEEAVAV
ncbi:MAG TPA: universal stress protein [Gaiellaceae bacterium]